MTRTTRPGHQALRRGRRSLPHQVYFITTVTRARKPVFQAWTHARCVSAVLADPLLWHPHRCLAWVLMPDHWHGLIQLGSKGTLAAAMCKAKSASARHLSMQTGRTGGLWAAGFHDRAIRSVCGIRAAARYLVANPLRAGLVDDVLNYPYWDAVWMQSNAGADVPDAR